MKFLGKHTLLPMYQKHLYLTLTSVKVIFNGRTCVFLLCRDEYRKY